MEVAAWDSLTPASPVYPGQAATRVESNAETVVNSLALFPWELLAGPVFGFLLFYGLAYLIKDNVVGMNTVAARAMFALKGLGLLFVVALGMWALSLWRP